MRIHALPLALAVLTSVPSAAAPARAQDAVERRIHVHARVGQTVKLRGHLNFRGQCSFVVPTSISVLQGPQHGRLDVRDEAVLLTTPELGRRDKCRGHSGEGKVVYYRRDTSGVDQIEYQSESENGVVRVFATVN